MIRIGTEMHVRLHSVQGIALDTAPAVMRMQRAFAMSGGQAALASQKSASGTALETAFAFRVSASVTRLLTGPSAPTSSALWAALDKASATRQAAAASARPGSLGPTAPYQFARRAVPATATVSMMGRACATVTGRATTARLSAVRSTAPATARASKLCQVARRLHTASVRRASRAWPAPIRDVPATAPATGPASTVRACAIQDGRDCHARTFNTCSRWKPLLFSAALPFVCSSPDLIVQIGMLHNETRRRRCAGGRPVRAALPGQLQHEGQLSELNLRLRQRLDWARLWLTARGRALRGWLLRARYLCGGLVHLRCRVVWRLLL